MEQKYIQIQDRNTGVEKTILVEGELDGFTWSPDSMNVYYYEQHDPLGSYSLFKATAPDFEPKLILEDIGDRPISPPIWVNP